jgi:hypothetical protein
MEVFGIFIAVSAALIATLSLGACWAITATLNRDRALAASAEKALREQGATSAAEIQGLRSDHESLRLATEALQRELVSTETEEEPPDSSSDAGDSVPPSAPRQEMPPDASILLVRSLTGADRGHHGSPGTAVISGAQEELALVAEMLLAIDTKYPEVWPDPPAIGNVLMALSDRILAGLEILPQEGGGAPPSPSAAEDDEAPPSSEPGGGPLPH